MSKKRTWIISLIIILSGAAITVVIFMTEPEAQKTGATRETAMLVDVIRVEPGNYHPRFTATGSVQAAKAIMLSPRIQGRIIRHSPNFVPGGIVHEGELLVEIDPSDYENTVKVRKSELQQAQADLTLEKGRQDIARQDYQLLRDTLSQVDQKLVLRQPQLRKAEANVAAARAGLEQARLNLRRTRITAPFDAQILERMVNEGSQVAPGDNLARLIGTDTFWVSVTFPVDKLAWIEIPDRNEMGAPVRIQDRKSWPDDRFRTGHIYRQIGSLEGRTRMARLLVAVSDPLGQQADSLPALMVNEFVETAIQGKELKKVFRLNRDHLRENQTVWVLKNKKLEIREAQIEVMDEKFAYLSEGLQEGDSLVTSQIASETEGAPLRTGTPEKGGSGE